MKEAIFAFVIALFIGAGINSLPGMVPPPPAQPEVSPAAAEEAAQAADLHNVGLVTDQTFDAEVLKSDKPVFVDCYIDSCVPCKLMTPVIAKLANKYEGKVKFLRMDLDANPTIAAKYSITTLPTFIIFSRGERGESWTGVVPNEHLVQALDKTLR